MPAADLSATLRSIPQVDRLLLDDRFRTLLASQPRPRVVEALRHSLDAVRRDLLLGTSGVEGVEVASILVRVEDHLRVQARSYYRRVLNATGVVLHTAIGRAVLPAEAVAALNASAGHYQRLEVDLETGGRGGRDEGCAELVRRLTGCEAATVVNNNAAATILILSALARGKKVVVSRGELVEIGGSFRIPEIMAESGALLSEVGATNRTHLRDYADAIGPETGLLLKVHTSNYRVVGFTGEVEIETLVALGRERGVSTVHDLGSGCLVDLAQRGLVGESLVERSISAGCDLVCFSGDKLLGGPQAGIIAGSVEAVERCRKHPLMRAFRPGRLTYTALEATLRLYLDGAEAAIERIPSLRRLCASAAVVKKRAARLAREITKVPGLAANVVPTSSQAGSGALPAREIPSWGVRLVSEHWSAGDLADRLRSGEPPILARVNDAALLLDVRTLEDDEIPLVSAALRALG